MRQKLLHILSFFSAVLTFGQVTLVAATEDREQKVNQRFNVTVMLEIAGENMEQETPLRMPDLSKFDIIGTASQQNTVVVDGKRGDVINQMFYQLVLSPKEAGRIKFGSVLVTVNGKIYKTEPFDIIVNENAVPKKNEDLAVNPADDVYLNLELEDKSVYQNEPVIAVLRAYSKNFDNFRRVRDIRFSQQNNIRVRPVSLERTEIESKEGLASQVIAVFMLFPEVTGTINIKPSTAAISKSGKSARIVSNSVNLKVKKLPEGMPENYRNAVGDFQLSVNKLDTAKFQEIDKPIHVKVKLEGNGNLNQVHLPKIIKSKDYVFYAPKVAKNIVEDSNKLKGEISAEYILIPKKTGEVMVNLEGFSYFSPEQKSYINAGQKALLINVMTPKQIADAKTAMERMNDYTNTVLETVNTPIIKTENLKVEKGGTINWLVVLGNLALVGLVLGIFYFFRKKIKKLSAPKKETVPLGSVSETEAEIRKSLRPNVDDYFQYMKRLKEENDISGFFSVYDEMELELRNHYGAANESEFRQFIESKHGISVAEQYRELKQRIQVEKYAPLHTNEDIEQIYDDIVKIYQQIDK